MCACGAPTAPILNEPFLERFILILGRPLCVRVCASTLLFWAESGLVTANDKAAKSAKRVMFLLIMI